MSKNKINHVIYIGEGSAGKRIFSFNFFGENPPQEISDQMSTELEEFVKKWEGKINEKKES
jgi:hypothetical protein